MRPTREGEVAHTREGEITQIRVMRPTRGYSHTHTLSCLVVGDMYCWGIKMAIVTSYMIPVIHHTSYC